MLEQASSDSDSDSDSVNTAVNNKTAPTKKTSSGSLNSSNKCGKHKQQTTKQQQQSKQAVIVSTAATNMASKAKTQPKSQQRVVVSTAATIAATATTKQQQQSKQAVVVSMGRVHCRPGFHSTNFLFRYYSCCVSSRLSFHDSLLFILVLFMLCFIESVIPQPFPHILASSWCYHSYPCPFILVHPLSFCLSMVGFFHGWVYGPVLCSSMLMFFSLLNVNP